MAALQGCHGACIFECCNASRQAVPHRCLSWTAKQPLPHPVALWWLRPSRHCACCHHLLGYQPKHSASVLTTPVPPLRCAVLPAAPPTAPKTFGALGRLPSSSKIPVRGVAGRKTELQCTL
jgi:hypothetical protein